MRLSPPTDPGTFCATLDAFSASSAVSCALYAFWRLLASSSAPAHSAPSALSQSGSRCPQQPLCTLSATLCPIPASRLAALKWSTPPSPFTALWIIHHPVNYSSLCGLLYSPAHSLHAVRCRQRFSKRSLPLPCRLLTLPGIKVALIADVSTDANRLFPSASWPFTLAFTSRYTWEDVRPEPHLLHLPLSSLHGDFTSWHLISSAPSHPLSVVAISYRQPLLQDFQLPPAPTAWSNGHH